MKHYYKVRKAKKWYQVYSALTEETCASGLTYYQATKLAKELNK